MDISKEIQEEVVVLKFSGNIDLDGFPELKMTFADCVAANESRVVLDLSRVENLSSSSVGAMMNFSRELRNLGGKLALASLSAGSKRVLALLRLDDFFDHFTDVSAAVRAVKP